MIKRSPGFKTFRLNRTTDLGQLTGELLIGHGENRPRCRQQEGGHNEQYSGFHNLLLFAG
jgi:hypothetical protein